VKTTRSLERSGSPVVSAFESRARRAAELAERSRSAREPLRFVAGLCEAQARAAAALEQAHRSVPFVGHLEQDLTHPVFLGAVGEVVRFLAAAGPPALSEPALVRAAEDATTAATRLAVFWNGDRTAADDFLSRALLRPYAELLRHRTLSPERRHARGCCPFCGGLPSVSCRRGASESDGASRFLVCALCGLEWPFSRILCPSCFESDPKKLPSFSDPSLRSASLDACETCRGYLKSIDLSDDGRRIPEIDELESIALDLWAQEQGFARREPGLAGL